MAAGASSSSSSSEPYYDVFLSFRGEDTRNNFTSHLHAALVGKKIKTYFDEKSLERGEEISPALLKAIERSHVSVIVFSQNYASSSWCLKELVHIIRSHRQQAQQCVLPIFYQVDPSAIRNQQGSYEDAFRKHEEKFKDKTDMVQQWRDALNTVANLAGYSSQDTRYRPEAKLVEEVVKDILKKLSSTLSSDDDFKGLFGFENQFNEIVSLLSIGSPNVFTLAIWGMGGMGKTTLAENIFNQFQSQFDGCCFLHDVREESEKNSLNKLRDELIAKLLKEKSTQEDSTIERRLSRTKVLIILDDVSTSKQLESLIGDNVGDRFGSGSRIIITTRDAKVVRAIGANNDEIISIYEAKQLNDSEGLELFNLKAFKGNSRASDYINLSRQVVTKFGGNPLAIKVLGSHLGSLRSQSKENWEMELEKLKIVPLEDIDKVLRISYDGLDEMDKNTFLDIACFFKGHSRDYVENMLNACGFFASNGIDNLIDKSLISQNGDNKVLHMHDLVQEMGWKIVHDESKDVGQRSRLWIDKDVVDVLVNNTGSEKIEGICLGDYGSIVKLEPTVFQRMHNLRFLIVSDLSFMTSMVELTALEYLPPLRYLDWTSYPLKHLPSNFETRYLVELRMPCSQLEELWPDGVKDLNALKVLDLNDSWELTRIPDLSGALNLERINLLMCASLVEFPWHNLQNLHKLVDLIFFGCQKLRSPAGRIDGRTLKNIDLYGCYSFDTLPAILPTSLVSLDLNSTLIKELPPSICSLKSLSKLNLQFCEDLTNIPSSMREMESLKSVNLFGCRPLDKFPELPRSIEEISMGYTAIKEVPFSSIEDCFSLRSIGLDGCKWLENLPTNIFKLRSLRDLDLRGCLNLKKLPEISEPVGSLRNLLLDETSIRHLPSGIGNLSCLEKLSLSGCENLEYIPNNICNLFTLTDLDISHCKNIELLPELPLSLKILKAIGCTSLVSTQNTPLIQWFGDYYEMTEETREYLLFYNCLKLDENGRQSIITNFQLRVLRMATRLVPSEDQVWYPRVSTCFPGDEIPKWFSNQSDGCSIHIKLPPQLNKDNFLGFALCVVVTDDHSHNITSVMYDPEPVFQLFCELDHKVHNGRKVLLQYYGKPHMNGIIKDFVSDHMFMGYFNGDSHCLDDAVEASFSFSHIDYSTMIDKKYMSGSRRIKKCGIRVLHRQDVDEFSLMNNQDLLEQRAGNIPDQPEAKCTRKMSLMILMHHLLRKLL